MKKYFQILPLTLLGVFLGGYVGMASAMDALFFDPFAVVFVGFFYLSVFFDLYLFHLPIIFFYNFLLVGGYFVILRLMNKSQDKMVSRIVFGMGFLIPFCFYLFFSWDGLKGAF